MGSFLTEVCWSEKEGNCLLLETYLEVPLRALFLVYYYLLSRVFNQLVEVQKYAEANDMKLNVRKQKLCFLINAKVMTLSLNLMK